MTIKVESVRLVNTNQNFKKLFRALFIFDSMLSNCGWTKKSDANITEKDMKIINKLLISRDRSNCIDPYISSMVESYIRTKTQVVINMDGLYDGVEKEHYNGLFILDELKEYKYYDEYLVESEDDNISYNLVSSNLFNILPNIKSLIINTGDDIDGYYPFNVFRFIDMILISSTWQNIQIIQQVPNRNSSWMGKTWSSLSSKLQNKCKENGLIIKYQSIKLDYSYYKESFSIEWMQ